MSKSTISTFQLFEMFPDEATARTYLESHLWPNGAVCPTCASGERLTQRKNGFYRCNQCQLDFTIRTGTIFERSHIPLHKWLYAMYLLVTARKGISSMQLAKEIGVTQKSAWFMLHRLREACAGELEKLQGTVEVDEAFFGGKEANKHESKKLRAGRGSVGSGGRQTSHLCEVDPMTKPPKILDEIVDKVLAYRLPEKQKQPRKRKKDPKRQTIEKKDERESSM